MNVGNLKKIIETLPDDTKIYIRNEVYDEDRSKKEDILETIDLDLEFVISEDFHQRNVDDIETFKTLIILNSIMLDENLIDKYKKLHPQKVSCR